jgi:hypothetical protein
VQATNQRCRAGAAPTPLLVASHSGLLRVITAGCTKLIADEFPGLCILTLLTRLRLE